ncbi:class I SAM-dependent methyltransferase [Saccharopolyspora taberi]|uniref:Class I SAM-dependent methyltransferase n=1 Tax=Saccharopolyspora taberi TaxID=60895 RepID=A0ABN3VE75_9PSEU
MDQLCGDALTAAFDAGAPAYDRLVGANPGYHAHLRLSARRMGLPSGARVLDAGCGTGASTAALLAAAPDAEILAVDASERMLDRARAKPWPPSVRFRLARVEELIGTGRFDAIFAAYLVRNLPDPDRVLGRFAELLRPGGTLAVHEYSVRDSLRARVVWDAVCWGIVVPLGGALSGRTALYRHLWSSVRAFDGVDRFRRRLREAGFGTVRAATVTGWQRGIVHTFLAGVGG